MILGKQQKKLDSTFLKLIRSKEEGGSSVTRWLDYFSIFGHLQQ